MPDRYDLRNILEKGFDIAQKVQYENSAPPLDEVSYVMGFLLCLSILNGSTDAGIDPDASLREVMDAMEDDVARFGRRVSQNQERQNKLRDIINGHEH